MQKMAGMLTFLMLAAVSGLVLAVAPAAQAADITVANPSFEEPDAPNTAVDPTAWTVSASGVWTVQVEEGWPATAGDQVLELRNEGTARFGIVSQAINVTQLAGSTTAVLTFDVRRGNPGRGRTWELQEGGWFAAYFKVNGVRDTADDFETTTGTGCALPDRQWVTKSVTLETSALIPGDAVEAVFHDHSGPRVAEMLFICVDNVRVEALNAGTLILIR